MYGSRSLAVVLTGMGDDGTIGCSHIKRAGGTVFTQDEASCVVYGMPKAVVEAHMSDEAHTLEGLAHRISELASQ